MIPVPTCCSLLEAIAAGFAQAPRDSAAAVATALFEQATALYSNVQQPQLPQDAIFVRVPVQPSSAAQTEQLRVALQEAGELAAVDFCKGVQQDVPACHARIQRDADDVASLPACTSRPPGVGGIRKIIIMCN